MANQEKKTHLFSRETAREMLIQYGTGLVFTEVEEGKPIDTSDLGENIQAISSGFGRKEGISHQVVYVFDPTRGEAIVESISEGQDRGASADALRKNG